MSSAMELSRESLETIGTFVRGNLAAWLQEIEQPSRRDWELQLTERIVRVEEELKAQRELMQQGFAAMDKRFSTVQWTIGVGFTLITVLVSVYNFVR